MVWVVLLRSWHLFILFRIHTMLPLLLLCAPLRRAERMLPFGSTCEAGMHKLLTLVGCYIDQSEATQAFRLGRQTWIGRLSWTLE